MGLNHLVPLSFHIRTGQLDHSWVSGFYNIQLAPGKLTIVFESWGRATGYCRIWITNYGLIAQPLYESLKGRDDSIPLMWGTPQKKADATLKQALTQAPAMRLPDPEKAFQVYVHEREGIASGVLTQRLGSEPQPVA